MNILDNERLNAEPAQFSWANARLTDQRLDPDEDERRRRER